MWVKKGMKMEKKTFYCVTGTMNGKSYSKPGIESYQKAKDYAWLKGWQDIVVICEGSKEAVS